MAMRGDIMSRSEAVNFVAAGHPQKSAKPMPNRRFGDSRNQLMERIPAKECVYVLMDANARTGRIVDGERLP